MIDRLSIKLARIALDLDELVGEIAKQPLTERDRLLLASPLCHYQMALEHLEELYSELEHYGSFVATEGLAA